jgi:hypothetical protein
MGHGCSVRIVVTRPGTDAAPFSEPITPAVSVALHLPSARTPLAGIGLRIRRLGVRVPPGAPKTKDRSLSSRSRSSTTGEPNRWGSRGEDEEPHVISCRQPGFPFVDAASGTRLCSTRHCWFRRSRARWSHVFQKSA